MACIFLLSLYALALIFIYAHTIKKKLKMQLKKTKEKILLHVCCAPCSTHAISALLAEYEITLFFYNPNIEPKEEYSRRLCEAKKYAEIAKTRLIIGEYDNSDWHNCIKGYENENENSIRCRKCYEFRLNKTAKTAKENDFSIFATTLTISPHKDHNEINKAGNSAALKYGIGCLKTNFKKNNGFLNSIIHSKKHNLYRQNYCGCRYSNNKITK